MQAYQLTRNASHDQGISQELSWHSQSWITKLWLPTANSGSYGHGAFRHMMEIKLELQTPLLGSNVVVYCAWGLGH